MGPPRPSERRVTYSGLSSGDRFWWEFSGVELGEVVAFRAPRQWPRKHIAASRILEGLGAAGERFAQPGESAEMTLVAAIRHRAAELAVPVRGTKRLLPGACPVIPPKRGRRLDVETVYDPDAVRVAAGGSPDAARASIALAALAVITQSTRDVWLRSREPRLERLRRVRKVTLWIPPPLSSR